MAVAVMRGTAPEDCLRLALRTSYGERRQRCPAAAQHPPAGSSAAAAARPACRCGGVPALPAQSTALPTRPPCMQACPPPWPPSSASSWTSASSTPTTRRWGAGCVRVLRMGCPATPADIPRVSCAPPPPRPHAVGRAARLAGPGPLAGGGAGVQGGPGARRRQPPLLSAGRTCGAAAAAAAAAAACKRLGSPPNRPPAALA